MSGRSRQKGSAAPAAFLIACLACGGWVLLMNFVLKTEKPVALPQQLATRHVDGPAATMSDMTWPTNEADAKPEHPIAAPDDDQAGSLLWPTRVAKLSSTFGYRINPISHEGQVHKGVDVPAPCGTEVVAVEEGIVQFAQWTETAGNMITLVHDGGWNTRYLHLSRLRVHAGQRVTAGELIGFSGDTGSMTTGPHLHFEIWSGKSAVDPMAFRYRALGGTAHPIAVACERSRPANNNFSIGTVTPPRPAAVDAASSVERLYERLLGHRG